MIVAVSAPCDKMASLTRPVPACRVARIGRFRPSAARRRGRGPAIRPRRLRLVAVDALGDEQTVQRLCALAPMNVGHDPRRRCTGRASGRPGPPSRTSASLIAQVVDGSERLARHDHPPALRVFRRGRPAPRRNRSGWSPRCTTRSGLAQISLDVARGAHGRTARDSLRASRSSSSTEAGDGDEGGVLAGRERPAPGPRPA